jgi:PAS domain S-box-containing protein
MRRVLASLFFAAGAIFGLARSGLLRSLFSANYLPHRFCYLAEPGLVWTNVTTDALIAASYALLFTCILAILRKLRGVSPLKPYLWIFLSFATFIMACGLTHLMEVVTVWWPLYPLSAAMKVLCAAVSVPTALFFARTTPVIAREIAGFFDLLARFQCAVIEAADCRDQIEAIDRSQMMIELNTDGTIIRVNEGVLNRFGYTHAQMAGKHHSMLLSDEDKGSQRQQELWEELRRGNFQSGEFRHIDAGGREVWAEVRYTPICGADGNPRKVVAFATDETERVTQRIADEKRIRQAEAHLQAIVDNVLVGIVMLDRDGTVLSMNPAAVRMFGYAPEEVAGLHIAALIPGPDILPRDRHLSGYIKAKRPAPVGITRELEGVTRNGHSFPIELTISEVAGADRRMFAGLVRDIKLRKRTEEERRRQELALRKSEELLERTGRLAGIGGWELDLETGELTWSSETRRILGANPSYRPSLDTAMQMYPQEHRDLLAAAIARAQARGEDWDLELPATTLDGRQIWARAVGTAEFVDGRAVRLWGAFQDITARVEGRKALDEANLRVALAAESGYVGIWDWDIATNKMIWDDWMCRLYGMEPQRDRPIAYRRWVERIHVDDRAAVEQSLNLATAGSRQYDQQFRIVWSDGTLHWIRATGHVTRDAAGRAVRMVGHNIDITDRKNVEVALRKSQAFLERTGKLAGVGGWEIDLVTSQVTWSLETCRLLGADPAFRPTLQEAIDLYTPESKPLIAAAVERACAQGEGFDLELSLRTFDGRQLWARAVGEVDFADGRPVRLWGAFQDITARVAERQALQEANTRAGLAAESGGIGIWDWDIVANTFTCDTLMYRLYGHEPEVEKRFDFEFWAGHVHPEDRLVTQPALQDAMDGGTPFDEEFRILWKDGTVRHVRSTAKVIRDPAGRPLRVIGTNTDITGRVAEREALKRANIRAALATQSGGIGIWDWDLATGKLTADDGMYRIVGLDPETYRLDAYEEWASHVHPEDRARVEQELRRGIEGTAPYDTDFRILWADGSLHYIKASGQVILDSAGKPARMVGTNTDITDRKSAEEALRRSTDNEKLLIQSVRDYAIIMLDPEGRVTTWNEGAERIKGYKAEEIVGSHFSKFYTPEAIAKGTPGRALQIARETGRYEEEGLRVCKDGSEFWASVVITAIFDEKGQLRGFGKVTRDITAHKHAQAAA